MQRQVRGGGAARISGRIVRKSGSNRCLDQVNETGIYRSASAGYTIEIGGSEFTKITHDIAPLFAYPACLVVVSDNLPHRNGEVCDRGHERERNAQHDCWPFAGTKIDDDVMKVTVQPAGTPAYCARVIGQSIHLQPTQMEITMTNYENRLPAGAIGALAQSDLDAVSGGCFGIPVPVHGGVVYVSPTTHFPQLPTGTGPTYPTDPWGPFPA